MATLRLRGRYAPQVIQRAVMATVRLIARLRTIRLSGRYE